MENMKKYLPAFKTCVQKEPAFCTARCPFHMDVTDFIDKVQTGRFDAAYRIYKNAAGFPAIACALCPEPCKDVCPLDEPIEMKLLEAASIEHAKRKTPNDYNLPKKKQKIAVIGAGISGMACALRLATKKYDVTVYERTHRIGGTLWESMDPKIFNDDFDLQFSHEEYDLHLDTDISSLSQLESEGYSAVYVATGKGGNDLGLLSEHLEEPCMMMGDTGVFAGGSLLGKDKIYALADGLKMSTTIDNFLRTGNLIYTPDPKGTGTVLDESRLIQTHRILPSADSGAYKGYSPEEAAEEGKRCLKCQCDACRLYCDLTDYLSKWPLRLRDEIQATTLPGSSEVKATPAKRSISTCSQCGLCKETCPKDIDLGGLILAARRNMHRQEKMPWVFNEFWLRDMDFANGPLSSVIKPPTGREKCDYAFFPGCQLGASDPGLVSLSYRYLLDVEPSTGIFLSCCGLPAEWAGNDELHNRELSRINTAWEDLGRPVLILACPSCANHFRKHLPHIETDFLYDIMADKGISVPKRNGTFSVFDPCSTRDKEKLRDSVRSIVSSMGIENEPLESQEKWAACCSFGGQGSIADPGFAKHVREKRIALGDKPYIAYCINCRDAFLEEGKETYHILDLVFDREPRAVTVSARRENRILLKENILKEFFKEEMDEKRPDYGIELYIDDELSQKLSREKILEEDMENAVSFCENTGQKLFDTEAGTYKGWRKIGHATYWVEYKPEGDGYRLLNGYSHRMEIEMEHIWNGHKTNFEV